MTCASARPPTPGQGTDYYDAPGSLLRMAWNDNFHFGYWDDQKDKSSVEEATNRLTDVLTERLRVGPGDRVLDAGCGIGKSALRLASRTGASVLGITISRKRVTHARERARAAAMSGQVSFEYADAMDMPFEQESFDAVLALESIIHMDRPSTLREMARVLVSGGRLALTDTFPAGLATGHPASHRGEVASMIIPAGKDNLSTRERLRCRQR